MSVALSNNLQPVPSLAHTPSHGQAGPVVQLYADDNFLVDVLSRFIGGAVAVGDPAVLIATKPHRTDLEKRLSANGLDTSQAAMRGRYLVLDATDTLPEIMVNGTVVEKRFNDMIGGVLTRARSHAGYPERPIAVFGELVALLWAEGKLLEAIRLEQLWNDLAKSHSFSLLCAYPISGFSDVRHSEPFLTICGQHSSVVPSESYLISGNEQERLRSIARLQQRAQALEKERALRQSEERFRLLVEAVQDYAIFMLDPDGKVSSWNAGAERIKGYKPHEILGKHFACFYPEEEVRNGKPHWELVIAAQGGTVRRRRLAGTQRRIDLLGECDHHSLERPGWQAAGFRQSHPGHFGKNGSAEGTANGSGGKARGTAAIARFGKVTAAIVPPPASHTRRGEKTHWKGSSRQPRTIPGGAEDEIGISCIFAQTKGGRSRARHLSVHPFDRRFDQGGPHCLLSSVSSDAGRDGSGICHTMVS